MKQKIVIRSTVLSVGKPFDFVPEGQTENIFGCKMAYVPTVDFSTPNFDEETEIIGHCPQEVKMDPSFYEIAKGVGLPCEADITIEIQFKTSGVRTSVVGVDFIKSKKEVK